MRPGIRLPWKVHAVLVVVFPLLLALPPCIEYGVTDHAYDPREWLMSSGFLVAAWVVAVPMIFAERIAERCGLRGWSLLSAACAHAALALVGTLPITLHWLLAGFGSDPIDQDWVRISVTTYAVLLGGYFLAHALIALGSRRLMWGGSVVG